MKLYLKLLISGAALMIVFPELFGVGVAMGQLLVGAGLIALWLER